MGSIAVGNLFKPTVSDLQLLADTREWQRIKDEEGIDENTVDRSVLYNDAQSNSNKWLRQQGTIKNDFQDSRFDE